MKTFVKTIEDPETGEIYGTGWLPPVPDLRDYTVKHQQIIDLLGERKGKRKDGARPERTGGSIKSNVRMEESRNNEGHTDLREWFSPVENQGSLGSCTAHAATGIIEYFQKRAFGKYVKGSRLFLYKTTRNLMQTTGDEGAWIRSTMGALVLCGIPPEKYYPYIIKDFEKEPGSFIYSLAGNYEAVKYFCHDPQGSGISPSEVLASVKKHLDVGIPSMFGFYGFTSWKDSDIAGGIPFPSPGETSVWGHAVVAAGYDDSKVVTGRTTGVSTTGALLIRNSWGASWGEKGYGWLPYEYVLKRLAVDFWSLISADWVDTEGWW